MLSMFSLTFLLTLLGNRYTMIINLYKFLKETKRKSKKEIKKKNKEAYYVCYYHGRRK